MTRTIYYVASSLDGFIADDEGRLDWLFQFGFETFQEHYDAFFGGVGAIVMGSATYEFLLNDIAENGEASWTYGTMPVVVFTTRALPTIPGANIEFTAAKVEDVHARLVTAAKGKDIWVLGGGILAAQFADFGLIDEIQLTLMPVALGSGAAVLPVAKTTPRLELLRTTAFAGGAIELVYRRGPLQS